MTPGNYSVQFLEWMAKSGMEARLPELAAILRRYLLNGTHFLLPDNGVLLPRPKLAAPISFGEVADYLPPYPVTVVEFAGQPSPRMPSDRRHAHKSIVVALAHGEFVTIISIWCFGHGWVVHPMVITFGPKGAYSQIEFGSGASGQAAPLEGRYWDGITSVANVSQQVLIETLASDMEDDLSAYYDLVRALSCVNVGTATIAPDVRLNAARARKGRPALFEYRVLTLGQESDGRPAGGHTGRLVRSHLRRGHIRRLTPDGARKVWVNATMVKGGQRGFVHKDYAVPAQNAPAGMSA